MYRDELFEKVWKILFSDKKDQVDCSDPEIRGIIRRMKRTLTTTEPDYKSMWKKLQVEQQRRRLKLFVRWSAAVILPVLVLSVSYLWRNEEPSLTSMRLAENAPEGVRLILSDSSIVSLQARQHFEIVDDERMNVRQDRGTRLVYKERSVSDTVVRYNTLEVPAMADYQIQLSDGTIVYMNAKSRLHYPVAFYGEERKVYLEGEAYFEVTKDSLHPFVVQASNVTVRVLGTSFNVNAYPDREKMTTTLEEGKVQVVYGGMENILTPGKQLICKLSTNEIEMREVDTEQFTSWKDGYYVFYKETLENIMERLVHWYGVEVSYQNEELRKIEFVGRLHRYERIDYLLKRMADTQNVEFVINGNVVEVKNKTD